MNRAPTSITILALRFAAAFAASRECRFRRFWQAGRWQLFDAVAHLQDQVVVNHYCFDEITWMEFAFQQSLRQGAFDHTLNGAAQRASTVLGLEPFVDQEVLRSRRYNEFHLLLGQLHSYTLQQQLDYRVHLFDA